MDGVARCIDEEIPFEIPNSWCWTRLGSIVYLLSGTDFKPEDYNDCGSGIPYITGASNIYNETVIVNRWTKTPRVIAESGDILIVCKGSGYGRTAVCNIDRAHIARQIMAIKRMDSLEMGYIKLFLDSVFDVLKSKGQGVIPGLDRDSILSIPFPLPPLAEQKRIIAFTSDLLPLCNNIYSYFPHENVG